MSSIPWPALMAAGNRQAILKEISARSDSLRYAPAEVKDDKEFVRAAVERSGQQLQYASESLRCDSSLCLAALSQMNPSYVWPHVGESLKKDEKFLEQSFKANCRGMLPVLSSSGGISDFLLFIAAGFSGAAALQYANEEQKKNRDLVKKAVETNGLALEFAAAELQGDEEIVFSAVSHSGGALEFARPPARDNPAIAEVACRQDGKALKFLSEEMKKNVHVVKIAVSQSPEALHFVPSEFLSPELVRPAIARQPGLVKFLIDQEHQQNKMQASQANNSTKMGDILQKAFPSPFKESRRRPLPLLEFQMAALSEKIRAKPNWMEKSQNPDILERWRREIGSEMPDSAIDYVFDELSFHRRLAALNGDRWARSAIDGIFQSDDLVEEKLRLELIECVAALENVPEDQKDWHPDSGSKVLDLVHPSLFPLINGNSRVFLDFLPPTHQTLMESFYRMGGGEPVNFDWILASSVGEFSSKKFQWLPAEFSISPEGKVDIQSYINNLHPIHHSRLYSVLGRIFECFIPLFECCLSDLLEPRPLRYSNVDPYRWYKEKGKHEGEEEENDEEEENEENDEVEDEEDEDYDDDEDNRVLYLPPVPKFDSSHVSTQESSFLTLKGRRLQVIVKLANIVLTPESPIYEGGSWHVEGMANERILASGIYYYQSENITDSLLQFRTAVEEPDYEQSDHHGVDTVYGLNNDMALNQSLGGILTKTHRSLVFPNLFQHRVDSFRLLNSEKPGIRKILVFFLIDPLKPVFSTERVPPQQREWILEEMNQPNPHAFFPKELESLILGYALEDPATPSLAETKATRLDLMHERKYVSSKNDEEIFQRPFSLCEH